MNAINRRQVDHQRPTGRYDLPVYATAKVHRDHHIEVAKALYSVPGNLIGSRVDVRADRSLMRICSWPAGQGASPPETGWTVDRSRRSAIGQDRLRDADLDHLKRIAASHGEAIGVYAAALLDIPLPWTKMRQVYALLRLVKKWGATRVDAACRPALDAEAINVGLIGRMLERGTEATTIEPALPGTVITGRFARDPAHFAVNASNRPHPDSGPPPYTPQRRT